MRTTSFSPCTLHTRPEEASGAMHLTADSVYLNHSLDASHLVSSSRQRKVWPTTTSPQAISMCREGALRQAGHRAQQGGIQLPPRHEKAGGDWVYRL